MKLVVKKLLIYWLQFQIFIRNSIQTKTQKYESSN